MGHDSPTKATGSSSQLALCVALLLSFFTVYGIIQGRIMTKTYGDPGEYFEYSGFLILCNRLVSVIFSICVMLYNKESFKAIAPHYSYATISLCNLAATFCQYEALRYLSFPLQTVLKNGKIVVVLAISRLILGKRFGWKDYAIAVGIMIGCSVFGLTGDIISRDVNSDIYSMLKGFVIMLTYLFFDGFTSTFQEKLFRGHTMSTNHQMLFVNFYSTLLSLIGLMLSNQLSPSFKFCVDHPNFIYDALELSLCSTFGQQVIYITIKQFGNVVLSTIMTTRQMISIVISSIIYSHHLSLWQWSSAGGVSACLYYSTYLKSSSSTQSPKALKITQESSEPLQKEVKLEIHNEKNSS